MAEMPTGFSAARNVELQRLDSPCTHRIVQSFMLHAKSGFNVRLDARSCGHGAGLAIAIAVVCDVETPGNLRFCSRGNFPGLVHLASGGRDSWLRRPVPEVPMIKCRHSRKRPG